MAGRRDQVLDAAVRVLGEQGTRALTHRAVDAAAALPPGTTSNHFRSRDALVGGVLERLAGTELAAYRALAGEPRPVDADRIAADAAAMLRFLLGPGRTLTLARHAIFLEAAWRPELRPDLLAWTEVIRAETAARLDAAGSPDPPVHARLLLAYLDGLLADQLARPDPDFDPERAVRLLLGAMLPGR